MIFYEPSYQAAFRQKGVVVIKNGLDRTALSQLRAGYDRFANKRTKRSESSDGSGFHSTIFESNIAQRKAVHRCIRPLIEPLLQSYLAGYHPALCTFANKTARDPSGEVPIHQDWSFVDESKFTSLGLWCPLVDVDSQNGCLHIVQGSHRRATLLRAACTPFLYPQLIPTLYEQYLTAVPMKAGDIILFDNRLFHCSFPNWSDQDRTAATAVLIPNHSRLMYYHAPDPYYPHRIERFEVEDDFYLQHPEGERPQQATSLGMCSSSGKLGSVDRNSLKKGDRGRGTKAGV